MEEQRILHINPVHFVQVVENALTYSYHEGLWSDDYTRWDRIYDFYEYRYLNPDSPEKQSWIKYAYKFPKPT